MKLGHTIWLRKQYRKKGAVVPTSIFVGPTIRANDVHSGATYDFLHLYRNTKYWEGQSKVFVEHEDLIKELNQYLRDGDPLQKFHVIAKILAFCEPLYLRSTLEDHILPAFFRMDPNGLVQVLVLNEEIDRYFGFLRANYTLEHYSVPELGALPQGFATLRAWDQAVPLDYLDTLLSILQVALYPYITLFHDGPFGLSFVFLFSTPQVYEPQEFPRSWLHWARSGSEFGLEVRNVRRALAERTQEGLIQLAHRRYRTETPLTMDEVHAWLMWAVGRLDVVLREISDPANFVGKDGYIDAVFALEHNLSFLRVLKRTLHALTTEEPPQGKFYTFEVADLLDRLSVAFSKRGDAELFKLLFNPSLAPQYLT